MSMRMHVCLIVLGLMSACTVSGNGGGAKPGPACKAGAQQACLCLGGTMGTQTCKSDLTGFDVCVGCPGGAGDGGAFTVALDGGSAGVTSCGSCAGCCNGSQCVLYAAQTNSICGPKGSACKACNSSATCSTSTGACITPTGSGGCDATSCPNGCCSDGDCYMESFACGKNGGDCSDCGGTTCEAGACTTKLDTDNIFQIIVSSIKVQATTASGSNWDYLVDTAPDPYVCFTYTDTTVTPSVDYKGCTSPPCQDQTTCTLNATTGLIQSSGMGVFFPGIAFTDGNLKVAVYDSDEISDDLIGQGAIPAQTMFKSSYSTGAFQQVIDVDYALQ